MPDPNRRDVLAAGVAGGWLTGSSSSQDPVAADELTPDQKFVMEAGMTRDEAECWKKIAEAAGCFFKLPELHPTDAAEVAQAIHVVQNKLLGRPTYRKYLQMAKQARAEDAGK